MSEQDGKQAKGDSDASERTSEASIYVTKKTRPGDGQDSVTYSVGVNGRTYLAEGSYETAVERIGEILREMD